MEIIIGSLIVLGILLLMFGSKKQGGQSKNKAASGADREQEHVQRLLDDNMEWMVQRWEAMEAKESQNSGFWFYDDPTDRQLAKLDELGVNFKVQSGRMTKGMCSDIIGLFHKPDQDELEVLKFFKVPVRGMNQSLARYETEQLLSDSDNQEKWNNRPAPAKTKEFLKFMGVQVPTNLTLKQANALESEIDDDDKYEEWDSYEMLYDELDDPDYRDDYGIKKVSFTLFMKSMSSLRSEGKTLQEIESDPDILIDKIKELKPDIVKD
jgi:hypothetical protein